MQRTYGVPKTAAKPAQPKTLFWAILGAGLAFVFVMVTFFALCLGGIVIYASGRILPGVSAAGVSIRGMTLEDAAAQIAGAQITLRDGERTWQVDPAVLGIQIDGNTTAKVAQRAGREDGSIMAAMVGSVAVSPVYTLDQTTLKKGLETLAQTINLPAANATIHLVNGSPQAIAAVVGRQMNVNETLDQLRTSMASDLARGEINLVMVSTLPTVTDAAPLLSRAQTLLNSPLIINAYDPIVNQKIVWTVPSTQWGAWLSTDSDVSGVVFSVDRTPLSTYLKGQALDKGRFLDVDQSISAIQAAVKSGKPAANLRVYNPPTKYQVTAGDTLGSIAWQVGIPFWQIERANPGVDLLNTLNTGQTITIPSKDVNLPLPIDYGKRIVVSISRQHMTVYDNGAVKWDWAASTGIPSSPTMAGIFQVQSHDVNAFAGNWNLYMPDFMGIYDAVPGFTNGIHGFPTRNGQGLLWQGDLGHKVTYGCILVSTQNVQQLYNWAEDGVVVEIQS